MWEDVAGRLGCIDIVHAFLGNITIFAANSAAAKQKWNYDVSLDSWPIWGVWQTVNPSLADQVAVKPQYVIHRDTAMALTKQGETRREARQFAMFLSSPDGRGIFATWGWKTVHR